MPSFHAQLLARLTRQEEERRAQGEALRRQVRARLDGLLPQIPSALRPQRLVLIGSLAWGGFQAKSDVDLVAWGLDAGKAFDLAGWLWERMDRPVQVIDAATASANLVRRAAEHGEDLHVAR